MGHYDHLKKGLLIDYYENQSSNLPCGLNIFLLHTSFDTLEMQNITKDHSDFVAKWRQMDYDFITSDRCQEILIKNETRLILWGEIKEIFYA